MAFHPVAVRKAARPSTSTEPTTCGKGGPETGIALACQVVRSTSFAPMRTTPGPSSLKIAMSGALVPVKKLSVMWVFSKLKPRKPAPTWPTFMPGVTLTVPSTVGPAKGGPPSTGVPQPESVIVVPPSSREAPDDSPDDAPEEEPVEASDGSPDSAPADEVPDEDPDVGAPEPVALEPEVSPDEEPAPVDPAPGVPPVPSVVLPHPAANAPIHPNANAQRNTGRQEFIRELLQRVTKASTAENRSGKRGRMRSVRTPYHVLCRKRAIPSGRPRRGREGDAGARRRWRNTPCAHTLRGVDRAVRPPPRARTPPQVRKPSAQ